MCLSFPQEAYLKTTPAFPPQITPQPAKNPQNRGILCKNITFFLVFYAHLSLFSA